MGTHSSVILWKVPWTEEPGESTKSQTQLSKQALKAYLKATVQTLLSLLTSLCAHIGLMPNGEILWLPRPLCGQTLDSGENFSLEHGDVWPMHIHKVSQSEIFP